MSGRIHVEALRFPPSEQRRPGSEQLYSEPADFDNFRNAVRPLGLYWLVMDKPPPASAFQQR